MEMIMMRSLGAAAHTYTSCRSETHAGGCSSSICLCFYCEWNKGLQPDLPPERHTQQAGMRELSTLQLDQ